MTPIWYEDPLFWVDAAGVAVTAVFSWLLYIAGVRAAKAAEGATRISELLYAERSNALYARRLPLLRSAWAKLEAWRAFVEGDRDALQKTRSVLQHSAKWIDDALLETIQDPGFTAAMLDVKSDWETLSGYWYTHGTLDHGGFPREQTRDEIRTIGRLLDQFAGDLPRAQESVESMLHR